MGQVAKDLGKRQAKSGGPRDNGTWLNIVGSTTMGILNDGPFMSTTYFNPTFEESEGMVMALDGNVLDSRKYSVIVFKENSNPNKGKILGNGENDSIGKGVLHPKCEV
ncbi:hypothetical protein GOBAR_AA38051 [Gossypium barbadense]|uniref:Uncharacterized protein n=1 Tax=Gossypium barbadense TaxID=3634 RepID=A0A2P5VUZ3_GOSBA|nr:hypothetical protein GOBAR_AA38051 [Gossypium barbadense]